MNTKRKKLQYDNLKNQYENDCAQDRPHLNDGDRRYIAGRGTSKNQSVALDMHVRQAIRHQKDGWSIPRLDFFRLALLTAALDLGNDASTARCLMVVVPKFDLSKESFRVASFMSTSVSSFIAVLFDNDGVSSWRQDKKVGYHGGAESMKVCVR
jgi:hypothetical protein